jgi:hypothetical protein
LFVVGIAAVICCDPEEQATINEHEPTKSNDLEIQDPKIAAAWTVAKQAVIDGLESPHGAEFGDQKAAQQVDYKGKNAYVVTGWVETPVLKTEWSMRIEESDGELRVVDGPHYLDKQPKKPTPEKKKKKKRRGTGRYLCCDGTVSPSCRCGRSRRGCCSHHDGVCGCDD